MRRNLTAAFHPVMRRKGVTANAKHRNRSVQSPVVFVMSPRGFALRFSAKTFQARRQAGIRAARKTTGLRTRLTIRSLIILPYQFLEVALQIHARVQARDLIAVAVEHLGRPISKE